MVAWPRSSWTYFGWTFFEQEQGGTRMPEIVEADVRQIGSLQERNETPLAQIGWIDRSAGGCGEDEPLIFVQISQTFYIFHLVRKVLPESFHGLRR